eukprot:GSMAST32.ASY1.ANO1.2437.1 assembled CDS
MFTFFLKTLEIKLPFPPSHLWVLKLNLTSIFTPPLNQMGICASVSAIGHHSSKTMRENLVKYHICDCTEIRKKYAGIDNKDFLGEGVSGTVKIVTRRSDGQKFALKVMRIGSNSATGLQQIRDEITLLASTDHPNVARLYEAFEEKGQNMYLVMELCTGGELFDRLLDGGGSMTEAVAASTVLQMLMSLNYIHNKNMVHRDLKLENFIYANNEPGSPLKMIDFGFSKKVDCMKSTQMISVVGTSYYIAPEEISYLTNIFEKKNIFFHNTSACDLWSIGVITYMLLSGNPPFNGDDDDQIMEKVRYGKHTMYSPVWQQVSDVCFIFFQIRIFFVRNFVPNKF